MLSLRDRRFRVALLTFLFVAAGVALYSFAEHWRANRQFRQAQEALNVYDLKKASKHLEAFLALRPTDGPAFLFAGQTARRRGQFEDAKRFLGLALEQGADEEAVAIERKLLRTQSGSMAGVEKFAALCNDSPKTAEGGIVLEALIEGSLRAFNYSLASWSIELWLKNRTNSLEQALGLMWRAKLHERAANSTQALADYRAAVKSAPEYVPVRIALVQMLLREDPSTASLQIDRLSELAPDDPDVRFLVARLHRLLGRPEEAVPILDALLLEEPKHVDALIERGRIALDLSQPQAAEEWLRRAWKLDPNQREVNAAMSDCLRLAGRIEEANDFYATARQIEERLEQRLAEMRKKAEAEKRK